MLFISLKIHYNVLEVKIMARIRRELRPLPAAVVQTVTRLGANIAAARINREWRQGDLAAKAGVDRRVIRAIEEGGVGVGIGAYVAALWAMGLHPDVADLASAERDVEGQTLAAARLGERVRLASELDDEF
jgi:transcriptional regulator with XRE-family HTH domain